MKYKYNGQWVDVNIKALDSMPLGSIILFAGTDIPTGWMLCDGTSLSEEEYPELFDKIGHTYGGSGTSFNLPNFKGRVGVGKDTTQSYCDNLGDTGGSIELQEHKHQTYVDRNTGTQGTGNYYPVNQITTASTYVDNNICEPAGTGNSGNLQPYIVVNYIIKVSNTTPTMASIVNNYSTSTQDGYSCNYINGKTGVELWINENPTSSFSAQDINIDLSSYSYIEVLYRDIIADPFIQSSGKIPVGYGNKTINHTWINGEGETLLFRVLRTTTSKVAFEPGYSAKLTDSTINTHNDCLIPYKIIGYK